MNTIIEAVNQDWSSLVSRMKLQVNFVKKPLFKKKLYSPAKNKICNLPFEQKMEWYQRLWIGVFLQIFYSLKEKIVLKSIGVNFDISDLETCIMCFQEEVVKIWIFPPSCLKWHATE